MVNSTAMSCFFTDVWDLFLPSCGGPVNHPVLKLQQTIPCSRLGEEPGPAGASFMFLCLSPLATCMML